MQLQCITVFGRYPGIKVRRNAVPGPRKTTKSVPRPPKTVFLAGTHIPRTVQSSMQRSGMTVQVTNLHWSMIRCTLCVNDRVRVEFVISGWPVTLVQQMLLLALLLPRVLTASRQSYFGFTWKRYTVGGSQLTDRDAHALKRLRTPGLNGTFCKLKTSLPLKYYMTDVCN